MTYRRLLGLRQRGWLIDIWELLPHLRGLVHRGHAWLHPVHRQAGMPWTLAKLWLRDALQLTLAKCHDRSELSPASHNSYPS